jgi:hypothetical protein
LVTGHWTLRGRDADGNDIDAGGRHRLTVLSEGGS